MNELNANTIITVGATIVISLVCAFSGVLWGLFMAKINRIGEDTGKNMSNVANIRIDHDVLDAIVKENLKIADKRYEDLHTLLKNVSDKLSNFLENNNQDRRK